MGDNLIAAFSGNLTETQIVAKTGTALVYFTSDLAFNLRGFNVSYTSGKCPYNCYGHGTCVKGACECRSGYRGDACEVPFCDIGMDKIKGTSYFIRISAFLNHF